MPIPLAFDIDVDFITADGHEGFTTNGVVPDATHSKSGVTIGSGVDLGQMSAAQIRSAPVSPAVRDKLVEYSGKRGVRAKEYLDTHPLTVTQEEAAALTNWKIEEHIAAAKRAYEKATGLRFSDLPRDARTVLSSVSYQGYGPKRAPKFWKAVTEQRWMDAVNELRNFGDRYKTRHGREADLLERPIKGGLLRPSPDSSGLAPVAAQPWKSREWQIAEVRRVALLLCGPEYVTSSPHPHLGAFSNWDEWFPSGEALYSDVTDGFDSPAREVAALLSAMNEGAVYGAASAVTAVTQCHLAQTSHYAHLAELDDTNARLESSNAELAAGNAELAGRVARLASETASLRKGLAAAQADVASCSERLASENRRVQSLVGDVASLRERLASENRRVQELVNATGANPTYSAGTQSPYTNLIGDDLEDDMQTRDA